jgi:hypothetical protein
MEWRTTLAWTGIWKVILIERKKANTSTEMQSISHHEQSCPTDVMIRKLKTRCEANCRKGEANRAETWRKMVHQSTNAIFRLLHHASRGKAWLTRYSLLISLIHSIHDQCRFHTLGFANIAISYLTRLAGSVLFKDERAMQDLTRSRLL